ncbi:Hypothetical protein SRAE_X000020500 [Strongyloides ratti]|uniref:GRAM domain-containing protein n=1 Tax=Strongyloides ratti TaxID=34506 RepID=A0A090LM09_STRRB|nr:Hypothetical protein SRAE_X000020500 [Strongyloides ratti]CEF70875.1 Hypothetical protein SRAE_X000020500 [Strongyloides ratti]
MSKESSKNNEIKNYKLNKKKIEKYFLDIIESFNNDISNNCKYENDTVKKNLYSIKNEIRRCLTVCEPLFEIILGWKEIIFWKQPFQSLCYISCYFYLSYYGYLLHVILILILLQIFFNYLYYIKNIPFFNIIIFSPRKKILSPLHQKPSHQMLYIVLQKVSIYIYNLSNFLEKNNSIFLWQKYNITEIFLIIIILFLLLLFILPFETVNRILMICLGIRIFIGTYIITNFPQTAKKVDFITYMLSEISNTSTNNIKESKKNNKYKKKQQQKKNKHILQRYNTKIYEKCKNNLLNSNIQIKNKLENTSKSITYYHTSTSSNDDSDINTIIEDNNNNVNKNINLLNVNNNNNAYKCRCDVLFLSKKFYGNIKIGTLFIEKKYFIIRYFKFEKLTYQYTIYPYIELNSLTIKRKNQKIWLFKKHYCKVIFKKRNICDIKFYILTNFHQLMDTLKRIPLLKGKLNQ